MAAIIDTNRFQDKDMMLSHFEDEIFVECPECAKRAIITREKPDTGSYSWKRTLKCSNCFYIQKSRPKTFHITLNCYCSHCADEIKVDLRNVNEKKEIIAIRCSTCGETENYKPRNEPQEWLLNSRLQSVDNYFGARLWLVVNFRGNDFWALNYKHLEYLKQYVEAGLRERHERSYWTMIEKLPSWITSGKNRDKILKLISDLERK